MKSIPNFIFKDFLKDNIDTNNVNELNGIYLGNFGKI